MITVQVEPTGKHPAPTGNPFKLHADIDDINHLDINTVEIKCSLKVMLPSNMKLEVTTNPPGFYVIGQRIEAGEIFLLARVMGKLEEILKDWDGVVGIAMLVEETPAKVRFIQKTATGGRIVNGDARPIDSNTPRDSES